MLLPVMVMIWRILEWKNEIRETQVKIVPKMKRGIRQRGIGASPLTGWGLEGRGRVAWRRWRRRRELVGTKLTRKLGRIREWSRGGIDLT